MCVAILTKPGSRLSHAQIEAGWKSNPHGGGFAFVDDTGDVRIIKGLMTLDKMIEKYDEYAERYAMKSPFLVHMRIATSGGTTGKNTHPFPIKDGALIHNGVMFTPTGERAGTKDDRKSDTRVFAEHGFNIFERQSLVKAEQEILDAIGFSNKLVFLWKDKSWFIMNEKLGSWDGDIWFSNSSCRVYENRRSDWSAATPSGRGYHGVDV